MEDAFKLPRIWWVTSGILGLFPLHAADHTWGVSIENTMSHVVSSYIPTLRALERAREKAGNLVPSGKSNALIFAMPETKGKESLNIQGEIRLVEEMTSGEALISPTKSTVRRGSRSLNMTHFACLGDADPKYPRKSTLYVAGEANHDRGTITLEDLATVDLENAQLAYLSVCSTAENKVMKLAEENLHVAAAFQLTGFRQVIGTPWKAKDWAARKAAPKFYESVRGEMAGGWCYSDKYALFSLQAVTGTRLEGKSSRPNKL